MVVRLLFFFVVLTALFWVNYYLVFRTNYFSKARVFEIGKTVLIGILSLLSALTLFVVWTVVEKFLT